MGGAARPCPLFVELCCGSAAVTLKLLGGSKAKPPVSYMGAKTGYAHAILWAMGLRQGQGAAAVLLNDPGPWSKVWRVLTQPEGAAAVAEVIRGWIGEDPKALWERLRAQDVPEDECEVAARWCCLQGGVVLGYPVQMDGAGSEKSCNPNRDGRTGGRWPAHIPQEIDSLATQNVARWLWVTGHGDFSATPRLSATYDADKPEGWSPSPPDWFHRRTMDAATYLTLLGANRLINVDRIDGQWRNTGQGGTTHGGEEFCTGPDRIAPAVDDVPPLPAAVSNLPAMDLVPPERLPEGSVVYIDPPYEGTTGYGHGFARADVLAVARRWSDAGALVVISEAEPLPLEGWRHVEITGTRIGQKRTFSKQKREWLTMSREPAWTPAEQTALFL